MLNQEKHRVLLYKIIKRIFESNFARHIAFKGGTACYFLHNLDRFSTDIDLDILSDIPDIDFQITQILMEFGEVKKGRNIILSYGKDEDNIKIDISRNIWKHNQYELMNFFGTDIKTQTPSTIFTNKLVALSERNANRDIYDVYFFFQNNWTLNEELILERTGNDRKALLNRIYKKLNNLPLNYKILDGLGEVLNPKQKIFVKERLIKELINIIEFHIHFV